MSKLNLNAAINADRAKGFFRRNKKTIKYTAVAVATVAVAGTAYYYIKKNHMEKEVSQAISDATNTQN